MEKTWAFEIDKSDFKSWPRYVFICPWTNYLTFPSLFPDLVGGIEKEFYMAETL